MTFTPIGIIRSPFNEQCGTPIQPALAGSAEGRVEVDPAFAEALADLDGFERIWLLYVFDRARPVRLEVTPYLDTVQRGLFATRAPNRPNPIGMSCVRLLAVEGCTLRVADIDVLDGTPLLDIKPYASRFDHWEVERCGWLDEVQGAPRADDRFAR
ncbi:MAG: tRNA (N6-threonylcarbamoyladenosine(37)-N6)-methyltransferase TrmO [Pseudomonadota bacterium]